MLRGMRWPLLTLLAALVLFGVSLANRPTERITVPMTATPALSADASRLPATPLPQPVQPVNLTPALITPTPDPILTYREGLVGQVQRLNPLLASLNPVDADISALLFEGLTAIDQYGAVVPLLAESWVVSFDGIEYVMTLRQDVRWHDGTPFTSADVAYTMSLLSSPDFPGDPALKTFWQTVETEALDDYLIRFRLAQPLATFIETLRIGILPYHVYQGTTAAQLADHPANLDPIGTGAYQLEAIRVSGGRIQQVDLRIAPVYRQRPEGQSGYALERFRFLIYPNFTDLLTAFSAASIDGYAARSRAERQSLFALGSDVTLLTTYAPALGALIFNWADDDFPVFREARIRQALVRGLDRTSLIERHLLNVAVRADSPMLPLSWADDYDGALIAWPRYDLEAARSSLASAPLRIPTPTAADGQPTATPDPLTLFAFSIMTPNDAALVNVAQELAAQWSLLNLRVTVEAVDAATYRARLEAGEFDAALVELSKLGSADPDIYAFWHEGQYPDGQNYGGVNDRSISEALERARRDVNGTNRSQYYNQFQRLFIERAIAIPLYYPLYTYAIAPPVSGVQLAFISAPPDRFLTLRDWTLAR